MGVYFKKQISNDLQKTSKLNFYNSKLKKYLYSIKHGL